MNSKTQSVQSIVSVIVACAMVFLLVCLWLARHSQSATPAEPVASKPEPIAVVTPPPNPPPLPAPQPFQPTTEIVGIGAVLSKPDAENGAVQITGILPNSPAEAAGLFAPLNIYKVDGISLKGLSLQECVGMLRGAAGTQVQLEVGKPSENGTFEVEVTRQRVAVPNSEPRLRRIPPPAAER